MRFASKPGRAIARVASLLLLAPFACSLSSSVDDNVPSGPGGGVGATCDDQAPCRDGLSCVAGKCAASGTTADGAPCTIGDECASGVCGPATPTGRGVCGPAGPGAESDQCAGDADCAKGLRCAFDGASFFPKCVKQGAGDVGQSCTKGTDCLQGLACTAGQCVKPVLPEGSAPKGIPPYVPGPSTWKGATCPEPVKGDISALFRVPRAGDPKHDDFYRLPFPNDAARDKASGKVSFANHPRDPAPPMGFDALKLYLDALEPEPFSNYPTVYFRLDGDFHFDSVEVGGDDPQTRFVDLTAGPDFGRQLGLAISMTNGRNRYICNNHIVVTPGRGASLTPGHTYGVIMKKGIKSCVARAGDGKCSSVGGDAKPSADFTAMVAATPPADAALAGAYEAYKPLRDWLAKETKKPEDLLVATVFTVGDPKRVASRLRASVRAATAPAAEGWVKCGSGAASPCPQAEGNRACGMPDPDFDEFHALVSLPIFQEGKPPYLTSKDGGAIASTDTIAPARTEKVCMAVTVPKGTPPANGWPVAIYAHGTGGSFRSHAVDASGRTLAKGELGVQFAVVGIDQVQHGPRRGESKLHPNELFFNFANPLAARFNAQQGAADQHALVRLVESLSIPDGAASIKLDGSKVVYWGHSQGATEGAIFLAGDTSVKGAVFTGQGATLADALTTKTKPVNIKDLMWIALSESGPAAVGATHPVVALLQAWADPADPLHYARADVFVGSPTAPTMLRNIFQLMGKDDTYTPFETQAGFAIAGGLGFVGPEIIPGVGMPMPSFEGNVTSGMMKSTAVFRQYAPPSGRDGHFVGFDVPEARADLTKFLARVARAELPKVPE